MFLVVSLVIHMPFLLFLFIYYFNRKSIILEMPSQYKICTNNQLIRHAICNNQGVHNKYLLSKYVRGSYVGWGGVF